MLHKLTIQSIGAHIPQAKAPPPAWLPSSCSGPTQCFLETRNLFQPPQRSWRGWDLQGQALSPTCRPVFITKEACMFRPSKWCSGKI